MNRKNSHIPPRRKLCAFLLAFCLLGGLFPFAAAESAPVSALSRVKEWSDLLGWAVAFSREEHPALSCPHQWKNGRCLLCRAYCPHERHARETGLCGECGEYACHSFREGVCTRCGTPPALLDTYVPDAMVLPAADVPHGQLRSVEIPLDIPGRSLCFCVYTPPSYDPEKQYNVLVLIGGGGDDQYSWLHAKHDYYGTYYLEDATGEALLDNMINAGLVAPLIVVTPRCDVWLSVDITNPGQGYFTQVLRRFLLPYVVSHYATFAASPAEADISAAREHFGIGGLSDGSLYAQNAGLCGCLDLFANFMCWSGQNQTPTIIETINRSPQYPIHAYVCGAGKDGDDRIFDVVDGYEEMLASCGGALREGENAWCIASSGWHGWTVWLTGLYNALQLAF